jgi:hypothetical protein
MDTSNDGPDFDSLMERRGQWKPQESSRGRKLRRRIARPVTSVIGAPYVLDASQNGKVRIYNAGFVASLVGAIISLVGLVTVAALAIVSTKGVAPGNWSTIALLSVFSGTLFWKVTGGYCVVLSDGILKIRYLLWSRAVNPREIDRCEIKTQPWGRRGTIDEVSIVLHDGHCRRTRLYVRSWSDDKSPLVGACDSLNASIRRHTHES